MSGQWHHHLAFADALLQARCLSHPVRYVPTREANRVLAEESLQGKDVIREPLILAEG